MTASNQARKLYKDSQNPYLVSTPLYLRTFGQLFEIPQDMNRCLAVVALAPADAIATLSEFQYAKILVPSERAIAMYRIPGLP
jgi:hypothetical protein